MSSNPFRPPPSTPTRRSAATGPGALTGPMIRWGWRIFGANRESQAVSDLVTASLNDPTRRPHQRPDGCGTGRGSLFSEHHPHRCPPRSKAAPSMPAAAAAFFSTATRNSSRTHARRRNKDRAVSHHFAGLNRLRWSISCPMASASAGRFRSHRQRQPTHSTVSTMPVEAMNLATPAMSVSYCKMFQLEKIVFQS